MIPRNEHPNPGFYREGYINLNGQWDFEFDFGKSGVARKFYEPDYAFSKKINVPFCPESELSGIGYKDFMNAVWYKRIVSLTAEQVNMGKAFIVFGAVDFHAMVYVNGNLAGEHFGGYTTFRIDATPYIKEGDNVITVYAEDDTRSYLQARGKQSEEYYSHGCDYTRTTGIWQTVYMEFCPVNYIKNCKVFPNIDDASVTIQADLCGNGDICAKAFWDNKEVGSVSMKATGQTSTFTIP
jgi:beta-galactosidase/beta-glucuronidase